MRTLGYLVRRDTKLFFKDKGVFFTSLIAPLIILLLFVTFLGNVYRDSFRSCLPEGLTVPDSLTQGFVGGWLMSSLLAVCCVTVAFSANMIMVQDRVTGVAGDFSITPVKRSVMSLGYYLSTAIVTGIICYIATGVGFLYLALVGWYLSAADVLLVLLDVFLLVLFGTALSSVVCHFLVNQGGMTAVSTIVSSAYGFLCGAYMPISQFSVGIQNVISFLPGTYGTALLHNHFMRGVFTELETTHFPSEAVDGIRDSFDNNLYFFGDRVDISAMYLILGISIAALIGIYVILNVTRGKKRR